jgi:hypothetical protein
MADSGGYGMISQLAGGGATTTLGVAQTAYGLYLDDQANKLDHSYQIPKEIYSALSEANKNAMQGMSAQEANNYATHVYNNLTSVNQGANDRKAGLIGLGEANQTADNAFLQYAGANDAVKRQNESIYLGQLQNMADYKEKERFKNVIEPYEKKKLEASGYEGAGLQNVSQGLQSGNTGGNPFTKETKDPYANSNPMANDYGKGYPASRDFGVTGTSPYSTGYTPQNNYSPAVTNPDYNPNQVPFLLQYNRGAYPYNSF